MMDQIINSLQENTLHMVLLAAVAIYLVFAILKRVIRIILIAAILLAAYLVYLHFNGAGVKNSEATLQSVLKTHFTKY